MEEKRIDKLENKMEGLEKEINWVKNSNTEILTILRSMQTDLKSISWIKNTSIRLEEKVRNLEKENTEKNRKIETLNKAVNNINLKIAWYSTLVTAIITAIVAMAK